MTFKYTEEYKELSPLIREKIAYLIDNFDASKEEDDWHIITDTLDLNIFKIDSIFIEAYLYPVINGNIDTSEGTQILAH